MRYFNGFPTKRIVNVYISRDQFIAFFISTLFRSLLEKKITDKKIDCYFFTEPIPPKKYTKKHD